MGGKGIRRREKNYKAAHGGYSRLPPPPKPNEIESLPSKLRKILDYTTIKGLFQVSTDAETKKGDALTTGNAKKKVNQNDESVSKTNKSKDEGNDRKAITDKPKNENDEAGHEQTNEKKKTKRKRNRVKDLRFDDLGSYGAKKREKRERKKKLLEAKKKKHKKAKVEEGPQFAGLEEIKFGDVVDAPPKLIVAPKALKKVQDASQERLRLKAVEAYRNRKGWGSRPGILLPTPNIPTTTG